MDERVEEISVKDTLKAALFREFASQLAWALAGYHGGPGSDLKKERELLVEAANMGLLPAGWIEHD